MSWSVSFVKSFSAFNNWPLDMMGKNRRGVCYMAFGELIGTSATKPVCRFGDTVVAVARKDGLDVMPGKWRRKERPNFVSNLVRLMCFLIFTPHQQFKTKANVVSEACLQDEGWRVSRNMKLHAGVAFDAGGGS